MNFLRNRFFSVRDPVKFPIFLHTQKRNPQTNLKDPNLFWDYLGANHEAVGQFLRLFSDLGTPKGFTQMDAWSGHSYRWINQDGSFVYVKIYAKSNQGIHNFTSAEAENLTTQNPDWATEDLFKRIETGNFPSWTMYAQVLTPEEAESFKYNVLDLTKDWPFDLVEPKEIGKFELNQNPLNYFAEVEQAAYSPSNTVEGWRASADPVLQQRLISYPDASRYRLGPNFEQIPVNCPMNPISNFDRSGPMSVLGNQGNRVNYYPHLRSLGVSDLGYDQTHLDFIKKSILSMNDISDLDFDQPRIFYNGLSTQDKANLINNIISSLSKVTEELVIKNVLNVFSKVSFNLSSSINSGLKK